MKIFIDGVLETFTALMLDDYPGAPGNKGAPLFTAEEFNALVTRADTPWPAGLDPRHRRWRRAPHARWL